MISKKNIINIPPFVENDLLIKNPGLFGKIFLIIKGKFLSFIINRLEGGSLCSFINLFYGKKGKVYFEKPNYYKLIDNTKFYYPNKRFLRIVNDENLLNKIIIESYCLDSIDFSSGDVILDCGANVGELNLTLRKYNHKLEYHAFEPDKEAFECLKLNYPNSKSNFHNIGLSDKNSERTLYLDSSGGNSSFVNFGSNDEITVESKTLDSLNFEKTIKLLKLEAEGFEPEVLQGSINTLPLINYISVDFGSERGIEQSNTVTEVNKFLYKNNFSLVDFSNFRTVGLYRNNNFIG
tara:strand:- start:3904 stop:4782 length:879 start_codon:yes stop_codon:yes gene_type:complete